ncbi:MAG: hypothetical protein JWQ84_2522, partial [Mucilaginibacter sp.]|nr:hypothetical protein [Mucilaginibacter sp.]
PDLEYAHETLGVFNKAKFFKCDDPVELANYMNLLIDNKLVFDETQETNHHFPFFKNWDDTVAFLSKEVKLSSENHLNYV